MAIAIILREIELRVEPEANGTKLPAIDEGQSDAIDFEPQSLVDRRQLILDGFRGRFI
ncbi:hypothetical protein [Ralstonia solanacearum]|uniref:hypothetical protein n=1 Tax=Ralstonia solanacearum TaxID=305 RepID=UPI0015954757|nr:hypothetical protein [Ralstonia solanacearum]